MDIFFACGAMVLLYFLFFGLFDRSHLATVTVFALFFSGYAFFEAAGLVAATSGIIALPLLFFAIWAASNVERG
ncbi:MAG: hypothetical protein WBN65_06245 [Gammaproteobacteria bacterium]